MELCIEISKLKAFAEVQKAGIDCSCKFGSTTKERAYDLKHAIDTLVTTVENYALACNDLENNG